MNLTSNQTAWVGGAVVFVLVLAGLGCFKSSVPPSGQSYGTIEDLQPYVEPYQRAYILTGSPVETEVVTEKSEGAVSFKFYGVLQDRSETPIDQESYTFDDREFRYAGNPDETFEPAIPLLKFPLRPGDKWDWSGTYRLGDRDRKATATVTTSADLLNTVAGEFSTVRSVVELTVETGSKDKHEHKLTFWFVPKRGVFRREFELSTTREPMPAKSR